MKVKNKQFISKKMTLNDLIKAFEKPVEDDTPLVDRLRNEGLIERNGRYYEPTEKLLDQIHLETTWKPLADQRRFLMGNSLFSKRMLLLIMNERTLNRLMVLGYFTMNVNAKYRKTDKLIDFLLEGEQEIWLK